MSWGFPLMNHPERWSSRQERSRSVYVTVKFIKKGLVEITILDSMKVDGPKTVRIGVDDEFRFDANIEQVVLGEFKYNETVRRGDA